jgi:DNA repair protein RecO (recombination protein O)
MTRNTEWQEGIVLRTTSYGEADLIVGLLTRVRGKISAFAPAARVSKKRYGGGLDLFSEVRAELIALPDSRSHLWRLNQIEWMDSHLGLRNRLHSLATASYLADCLWNLLGEGDPHEHIYEWWKKVLIDLSQKEISDIGVQYDVEMLTLCGYAPRWNPCAECGRAPTSPKAFFSYELGRIICQTCKRIGTGAWIDSAWIPHLENRQPLPPEATSEVRQVLNAFVSQTLGREPKSQRWREEMLHAAI